MKSEDKNLYEYLMDMKGQLTIPIYQRNFAWEEKHYSQLFNDILEADGKHWIDRIVTKHFNEGKSANEYYEVHLIDGQQRLTTILTLFTAICAYCKHNNIKDIEWQQDIYDTVLINPRYAKSQYQNDEKYKLKISHENEFFKEIIDVLPEEKIRSKSISKIRKMYNYFYLNLSIDNVYQLWENILKVEIIDVVCENKDDGGRIFKTINFTGKKLETFEVIRNLSLLSLPKEEQNKLDEKYWKPLREYFKSSRKFNSFFTCMIGFKTKKSTKVMNVLTHIEKLYFKNMEIKDFFKDIEYVFELYKIIVECDYHGDIEINEKLIQLKPILQPNIYYIIMKIFNYYELNYCSKEELILCLKIYIVHVSRATIAGMPFSKWRDIISANINPNSISASFYNLLIDNVPKINDERFKLDIKRFDFYKYSNNLFTKEILYQLEHYHHSNEKMARNPKATIEHIMPQTLTEEWEEYLGENAEVIHKYYLNKLGNLTIASYNSKLSNKSFDEKKHMEDGFCHDRSYLSKDICKYDKWDEKAIKERTQKLAEQLCKIYPYPNVYQTF